MKMKNLLISLVCAVAFLLPALSQAEGIEEHVLTKVYFDTDKDLVKPDQIDKLREAADTIRGTDGQLTVILIGNADKRGKRIYNLELADRRAKAVRKVLTEELEVKATILLAFSYGEERPAAPADDVEEHLSENRRVDVLSLAPMVVNKMRRNRVSLYGGAGPNGLKKTVSSPTHAIVKQLYGPVFGLGYSRLITDRWSIGVSGFTNLSFFLNVGFDF